MRRLFGPLLATAALVWACGGHPPTLPSPDRLAAQVTIRRDTYGIPHILGVTEAAAAFGFGYAQAEDHAVAIGRRYISARGEEAKYFGAEGLANDLAMAQFRNVEASRAALERISPTYRRLIAAYAAGVNRYVASHRAALPEWMPELTAADVLAHTRASAVTALANPALVRRLQNKYQHVLSTEPDRYDSDDAPGSNALAIGGSRSTTGRPILLGNPHLQWASLYWEAHVRVPGAIDFYGSTLVGIPVLRAGFNDRLGFVTTNNAPDLDDVFTLTLDPQRPDHYRFDGRSLPLERRDTSVSVRAADGTIGVERRTVWSSHVGPIIHRDNARAFAVRSSRLDAFQYFEGFYLLSRARTLDEWNAALRRNYVPTSNFTYADADGNIQYIWNGKVARRSDGRDYSLDVDAATPADLWQGFHPTDELPTLLNPPGGYVQNANNPPAFTSLRDPIDMSAFPSYFERGPLALRPQLALDLLEARDRFSVQDVIDLKFSTRMLLADRVKPDLVAAVRAADDAGEEARAGAEALDAWDNRAAADSRGAVLFQRFWDLYAAATRTPFATPWQASQPAATPSGLGDRAAGVTSLAAAVRAVRLAHGSERVPLGDVHRFRAGALDLRGDGASGTFGAYRVMTFAEPPTSEEQPEGQPEPTTRGTRVAGHLPGRDEPVGFGDGWILVVDFSAPGRAWSVLAYGQTTNPDSPHSHDQLRLFAEHRLRPAWYSEAEIRANLQREYRP